jgi:hypothetical protein
MDKSMSIKQLMELFKKLHPNQPRAERKRLAREVYADLRKPQLTIKYKDDEFTVTQHTKEPQLIQGVSFDPLAVDIFDCCLGHLVNQKNLKNYAEHYGALSVDAMGERFKLMYTWLEEQNSEYIEVLEKELLIAWIKRPTNNFGGK